VERREERAEPDRSVAAHIDRDETTENKDTEESVASAIHPLANLNLSTKEKKIPTSLLLRLLSAAV